MDEDRRGDCSVVEFKERVVVGEFDGSERYGIASRLQSRDARHVDQHACWR